MNKRNDDFYMADSFNRLGEIAYCSANAISDCTATAVKGIGTLGSCLNTTTVDTMSWEPMATVSSVDTLSSKVAEMAKSIEALKKSFEALDSKPLRPLRNQLCTLNTERYR